MTDFDFDAIAPTFDQHVRGELPFYQLATDMVAHLVRAYLPQDGVIFDIGCATGNIGRAITRTLEEREAIFLPLDNSHGMQQAYSGPSRVLYGDIGATPWPFPGDADVIVSFLTLMFVPPNRRSDVFSRIMAHLRPGGVLLLFERFESAPGYAGLTLQRLGWAGKLANGVKPEDIVGKEMSLSGVQRPLAYDEVPHPFVRCFQYGDFAGFICPR